MKIFILAIDVSVVLLLCTHLYICSCGKSCCDVMKEKLFILIHVVKTSPMCFVLRLALQLVYKLCFEASFVLSAMGTFLQHLLLLKEVS